MSYVDIGSLVEAQRLEERQEQQWKSVMERNEAMLQQVEDDITCTFYELTRSLPKSSRVGLEAFLMNQDDKLKQLTERLSVFFTDCSQQSNKTTTPTAARESESEQYDDCDLAMKYVNSANPQLRKQLEIQFKKREVLLDIKKINNESLSSGEKIAKCKKLTHQNGHIMSSGTGMIVAMWDSFTKFLRSLRGVSQAPMKNLFSCGKTASLFGASARTAAFAEFSKAINATGPCVRVANAA